MSAIRLVLFAFLISFSGLLSAYPTAKLTIKVVDESGSPIENANVGINFEVPKEKGAGAGVNIVRKSGMSDSKGLFTAEGETMPHVSLGASHDEYYPSKSKYNAFTGKKGFIGFRRYEPWNPVVELVLKKIIEPIPMYAVVMSGGRKGEYPEIPVMGRFVGFDLAANDWVAPHGLGVHRDFLFKIDVTRAVSNRDYDVTLTLKFSGPGDGLVKYRTDNANGESLLRMPHHAPVSGYDNQLVQRYHRIPGVRSASENIRPDPIANYFFRVRTKLDNEGNVIGGLYGKIHGAIVLGNFAWLHSEKPYLSFDYYLNPNDNDTSVEFDPKRNLFTSVPHRKRVTDP